ncbi:MAG TPA: hypothetical protein VGS10_21120 [Terracidiphilus sp.]|nr:hypothetical protein [Terracidiphilus sp.]
MAKRVEQPARNFNTADRSEVPTGRNGKHKSIVTRILNDLDGLEPGLCLKIPLSELPDSAVNIRSALNRAMHKANRTVATATDEQFLYIWNS